MLRYRFGDFEFDPRSGELTCPGAERAATSRLSPQPAKLLLLLIEKSPEIVEQAEIQEHLWPEVEVAFEQSLHHCIRQIRTALDDSATEPRYIRTIHRRGYQFIADVEVVSAEAVEVATPSRIVPSESQSISKGRKAGSIVAVVIALVVGWYVVSPISCVTSEPVRIAVMTFQPPGANANGGPIAEQLMMRLTNHPEHALEVIGPTTTASFERQPQPLATLAADLDIDYILNGRFSEDETEARFLAEVIRARDGAHVWVQYFSKNDPDSLVAATITEALLAFQQEHP